MLKGSLLNYCCFCFAFSIDDYQLRTAFQNMFALKTIKNVVTNIVIFLKI